MKLFESATIVVGGVKCSGKRDKGKITLLSENGEEVRPPDIIKKSLEKVIDEEERKGEEDEQGDRPYTQVSGQEEH